jgi:uncharacterized protein (TIGR03435 family)
MVDMRHYFLAAVLLTASVAGAVAQRPTFEVASIKGNVSGSNSSSERVQPTGRIDVTNSTLFALIGNLYRVESFQIVGGPDWIHTDRWDIVAKAPQTADQPTLFEMAKALLADRFKLVVRTERREMPIYALIRRRSDGPLGPQMQPSLLADCPTTVAELRAFDAQRRKAPNGAAACSSDVSPGRYFAADRTMADVARVLTSLSGRTVVDKTGLAGRFDLDLKWNESEDGPSLVTALQEQLGLKLDSQRGPVDVLVIDSAERPTED